MNQESMVKALQAIYEEAERLRKAALPTEVAEGLDLIMSIARYGTDVRGSSSGSAEERQI